MKFFSILAFSFLSLSAFAECRQVIDGSLGTWQKVGQEFLESKVLRDTILNQESELQVRCSEGTAKVTSIPFYDRATYSAICEGPIGKVKLQIKAKISFTLCKNSPTTFANYKIVDISVDEH